MLLISMRYSNQILLSRCASWLRLHVGPLKHKFTQFFFISKKDRKNETFRAYIIGISKILRISYTATEL